MARTIRFTVLVAIFLGLIFGGQYFLRYWNSDTVTSQKYGDPMNPANNKTVKQEKEVKHLPRNRPALPTAEEIAKLPGDGGKEFNRLIFEKSPYLLQHARNPVDWYPWGDEAFQKAKTEGKPIFLSIGYSTCHWCHVMEHESFENPEIASLMNKTFVCIKLDREERPDIDNIYMTACQAMNGNGGWPLNAFLTSDKKPFFIATYIPPKSQIGRLGMKEFVPRIGELWKEKKKEILADADRMTKVLQKMNRTRSGPAIDSNAFDAAYKQLQERFDSKEGGFSKAPKFPSPHTLSFLLRYHRRTGNAKALSMVEKTLTKMRQGGIYDQVGFGFHRYSTDRDWLLPHFEKMLYDQATLTMAYTEAYQVTSNPWYRRAALETIEYVQKEMTSKEGGFFSAEDADSEGIEGKFYLWTYEQLEKVLSKEEFSFVVDVFEIEKTGNFSSPHCPPETNILHLQATFRQLAKQKELKPSQWQEKWEKIRVKLYQNRKLRIPPYKDDKILTDWNGLMIASMAKAGKVFQSKEILQSAKNAGDFVLEKLIDSSGRLVKRYRNQSAGLPAHLDDYAFTVWGMLELYEATFDVKYLQAALRLNKQMIDRFWDKEDGAFFFTADDSEKLLVRAKEAYDGAIPSGNSVAMSNLAKLARMTGDIELEKKAIRIGEFFSLQVNAAPAGHAQMLCSADFLLGPSSEVVFVQGKDATLLDLQTFLSPLNRKFHPNKVVISVSADPKNRQDLIEVLPFLKNQPLKHDRISVYVCKDRTCRQPTGDPEKMMEYLDGMLPKPKGSEN